MTFIAKASHFLTCESQPSYLPQVHNMNSPCSRHWGKNKVQHQYWWSYYYLLPLFDTCCITCFVGSVYQPALLLELTVVTDQLGFVKSMHGLNNWRWQLSLGLRCTQVPGWVITGLTPFYCRCHSPLMHLLWLTSVITILYQTYFLMRNGSVYLHN